MTAASATISSSGARHIRVDAAGVPWIEGTQVKVREVVLDRLAHGWSPEEIHFQHPNLSLAQIHSAFAWYYDHQEEMDAEMERSLAAADADAKRDPQPTPLIAKLRRLGHLR
jgi:uncharacterized protein (DUF433 family)